MTIAVKDVVDIAGLPTRLGSAAYREAAPAAANAAIVDRLLANDFRIIGKTKMHELAYGVTGLNAYRGTPKNVKFPALIPGGSSSGSAAIVAAGGCDAAIGTDTGGSIRVPAACCGVLGLKPTYGRVSRDGFTPQVSSLDCAGPFAKDASTLSTVMGALVDDWRGGGKTSFKLKFLACDAAKEITAAAKAAAHQIDPSLTEAAVLSFESAHEAGLAIIARETYAAFGDVLEGGAVDDEVAKRLRRAADIPDAALERAEKVRVIFREEVDALLTDCDALALPTLPIFPPRLEDAGDLQAMVSITSLCRPFNLSGHPAISIPLRPIGGRPAGLQLVARQGDDETLVDLARAAERLSAFEAFAMEVCDV